MNKDPPKDKARELRERERDLSGRKSLDQADIVYCKWLVGKPRGCAHIMTRPQILSHEGKLR